VGNTKKLYYVFVLKPGEEKNGTKIGANQEKNNRGKEKLQLSGQLLFQVIFSRRGGVIVNC